jgi:co-chaperonin GroES (HSP10)
MSQSQEMAGTVEEAEESIKQLARRVYHLKNRTFRPLWPWVFVMTLPKDQIMQNGLYLPAEQNKTVHEGIVLATWEPFIDKNDEWHECNLELGEHVLFPHFSGMPIPGYSNMLYRVVRSEDWKENEQGGVFCTVEHKRASPVEKLRSILERLQGSSDLISSEIDYMIEAIEKQFLLIDRDQKSVTLSGR